MQSQQPRSVAMAASSGESSAAAVPAAQPSDVKEYLLLWAGLGEPGYDGTASMHQPITMVDGMDSKPANI